MLVGLDFVGYPYEIISTPISNTQLETVEISNGFFDEVLLSEKTTLPLEKEWDYNTIFRATFDNNLFAGNVPFVISMVDSIIVKRRRVEDFNWIPLRVITIDSIDDSIFEMFDNTVLSNQEYEYALVSSLGGVEGAYSTGRVYVKFEGMFVVERDFGYGTNLEIQESFQKETNSFVINTLDNKYPHVICNTENDYYSGNINAVFVSIIDGCILDFEHSYKYREELDKFLNNKKGKILKFWNGAGWIVSITGAITSNRDFGTDKVKTSFNFTQIGDPNDIKSLANSGFIEYSVI